MADGGCKELVKFIKFMEIKEIIRKFIELYQQNPCFCEK